MGLCLGCCPRDSDNESIGPDGDRSRLINGEVLPNDSTHFRDSDEENDDFPYGSLGDNNRHIGKFVRFLISKTLVPANLTSASFLTEKNPKFFFKIGILQEVESNAVEV